MTALTLADATAAASRIMAYEDFIDEQFEDNPDLVVKVRDLNAAFVASPRHAWSSDPRYVRDQLDNPRCRLTRADLLTEQAGHRAAYAPAERTRRLDALDGTDHEAWPDREYRVFWRDGCKWLRLDPIGNDTDTDTDSPPFELSAFVAATVARYRVDGLTRPLVGVYAALIAAAADHGRTTNRRELADLLLAQPGVSIRRRSSGKVLIIRPEETP